MLDLVAMEAGFWLLFSSWEPWMVVIPGLFIGLIGGALPGISGTMTMALVLPFVVYMDFLPAILFLTAVFTGGNYGGAVPAILINLPGTTSSVSSAFDGFPMARRGEHNEALGLGLMSSSLGAAASYLVLLLVVNFAARAVLALGPSEMFIVGLWGLTMIAALSSGSMLKGLVAGALGLVLGCVGMGTTGVMRGTFGLPWLIDGIPSVPAMMGLLAVGQLFMLAESKFIVEDESKRTLSLRKILSGMAAAFRYRLILLRGSLIGVVIGAIPGVGSSVANLISYGVSKRSAADGDSYGQGNPGGLVASESANSSSEGGTVATMLAIGIPGGGGTAVLLAAFAMHNVVGGPRFIQDNKDIVYAIILSNLGQALLMIPVGILFIRMAVSIVKVPLTFLIPSVLVLAVAGSYSMTGDLTGPGTLVVFSLLGWLMTRFGYSTAAAVVGLLLASIVEGELVRSWQISGGSVGYFLGRPIFLTLLFLLVLSMVWRPLRALVASMRRRPSRM